MNAPKPDPTNPTYLTGSRMACPQCAGPLSRVPRRLLDRLTSIFKPVQRYRCRSFACHWEGNIASDACPVDPTDHSPR